MIYGVDQLLQRDSNFPTSADFSTSDVVNGSQIFDR